MRIALLTLEALAAARAVRRFVASNPGRIALVGLSDPFRPERGGSFGQTMKRARASGPEILPYLFLNFSLPRLAGAVLPRSSEVERVPLKETCERLGIPSVDMRDVNGEVFRRQLAESGADLIVTFHVDQILRAETIAAVPLGGINVHCALLPKHRGPVPTVHGLLDDPIELGVTIHRLVPKIDAGGMLAQVAIPDRPGLTALEAAGLAHEAAVPLLETVLAQIEAGTAVEQPLETLPYRGFPTPADMRALRRKGRSAAGWRDVVASLRTPA